jgi:hypothetical protein
MRLRFSYASSVAVHWHVPRHSGEQVRAYCDQCRAWDWAKVRRPAMSSQAPDYRTRPSPAGPGGPPGMPNSQDGFEVGPSVLDAETDLRARVRSEVRR